MVAMLPLLGVSGPRASVSTSSALTMAASACLVAGSFSHLVAWNEGFAFVLRSVFLVVLPVVLESLKSSFE